MAEEKVGFFSALWRFVTFWKLRKALGLVRAADAQFTGSVDGIKDAYTLHRDKLVSQYQEMRDAVSSVEMILEQNRQRLDELNHEEQDIIQKREGALVMFEEAQASGNAEALEKHKDAFERFDSRILAVEEEQQALLARISESEGSLEDYLRQLTKLQSEIQQLPEEQARAISDYVTSNKLIELNDRLQGLKTSIERGPIDAVVEQNKKLTAKARISQKLAGTDVERQDEQYETAGRRSVAGDRMSQMLSARKVEREAKTGESAAQETKEDRPEI